MQKVVIHRPGGYAALRIETHPAEAPGAGELCIRTRAIGVNYADCIVRMGLYESARKLVGYPITPGFEVAGEVSAVGRGVTGFRVGDAVLAVTQFGGYATQVVVPSQQVFHVPRGLDITQAAALPTAFLTAYFALFELAHVRKGETLLVHSAAGGVGSALTRLGKRAGCRVVGVVGRADKVAVARAQGCDVIIDKSREPLWRRAREEAASGYHCVLDANGAETLKQSYAHLASPGKLVVYGFHSMLATRGGLPNPLTLGLSYLRTPRFDPLRMTGENRSVLAFNLSYLFARADLLRAAMDAIVPAVGDGTLGMPPIAVFPFARVADAHRALEGRGTVGKLVLEVGER
jgi:NADPH:quinone reductase-like Zn-dependent oxidoreductase